MHFPSGFICPHVQPSLFPSRSLYQRIFGGIGRGTAASSAFLDFRVFVRPAFGFLGFWRFCERRTLQFFTSANGLEEEVNYSLSLFFFWGKLFSFSLKNKTRDVNSNLCTNVSAKIQNLADRCYEKLGGLSSSFLQLVKFVFEISCHRRHGFYLWFLFQIIFSRLHTTD